MHGAGDAPVEHPGDAAHAEPAADAEREVPDKSLVEVFGEAFKEGIVTGGDVALEALGELNGDPLGVRVAGPRRPFGHVYVVLLVEFRFRSRRIPPAQSEAAAVELGDAHAGQFPDPERHLALRVTRQTECASGGDDVPCAHAATLLAGDPPVGGRTALVVRLAPPGGFEPPTFGIEVRCSDPG